MRSPVYFGLRVVESNNLGLRNFDKTMSVRAPVIAELLQLLLSGSDERIDDGEKMEKKLSLLLHFNIFNGAHT